MEMEDTGPCYVISVAARMLGIRTHTLRYYERIGLVEPHRSRGNIRLYSAKDVEKLHRVRTLMEDLGVNLAGIGVILRMAERMTEMEEQMHQMEQEIKRLKELGH